MGFIDRIRDALALPSPHTAAGLASPWGGEGTMSTIVARDIFGATPPPRAMTRVEAIRLPAVARSRGLIASTIARIPLLAEQADGTTDTPPAWLVNTAGTLTPFHRMLWTVDDLFFYGWSVWAVDRDATGNIVAAERVAYDRWATTAEGTITIDGHPAAAANVIVFPGVTEGILDHGRDTLNQSARLAAAAARASENPAAQVELHQTTDAPMTDDEIDRLIARWAAARRGDNGGVAYTSSAIEVKEHGSSSEHLLLEGRNAAAVDVARHAGIPATMIDATLSGSSLSYQNSAARMAELVTFGLAPHMASVASRLSQDDVTPPGWSVKFNTREVLAALADMTGQGGDDDTDLITIEPEGNRDDDREAVQDR